MAGKIALFLAFFLLTAVTYPVSTPYLQGKEVEAISNRLFEAKYFSLNDTSLKPELYRIGLEGFERLKAMGLARNDSLLTLIDFSLPSTAERFFVINILRNSMVCRSLVAHGRNSGELFANKFSNRLHSFESSLGFFITGNEYTGTQGCSLQLIGMDKGFNDRSLDRGVVIHGAPYATPEYALKYGRLGRSLGCPALPPAVSKKVIQLIRDGAVVFCYYPDPDYIHHSTVLNRI
jgi:hypothetical protein